MPEASRKTRKPKKLLTLVRETIRRRRMSSRTEEGHVNQITRYIYFHGKRHPVTMVE